MLDYGFANVILYEDRNPLGDFKETEIRGGEKSTISVHCEETFQAALLKTDEGKEISKNVRILEELKAPIKKGEIIGEMDYLLGGEVLGTVPICASEEVKEKTYLYSLKTLWSQLRLDT